MFTGIIEAIGRVTGVSFPELELEVTPLWKDVQIGESIAVDGICLTVVKRQKNRLTFDVIEETEKRTALGELNIGGQVNLERSLKPNSRLGGHFVTGHIDGVGKIYRRAKQKSQETIEIETPAGLVVFMSPKGSIAVDGISLTLGPVGSKSFTVYLIPHTLQNTVLGKKQVGQKVNIETDILAKYVVQYLKNSDLPIRVRGS